MKRHALWGAPLLMKKSILGEASSQREEKAELGGQTIFLDLLLEGYLI